MATAQKMVDAEAEISRHKKNGSGDAVTDAPCQCEGCQDRHTQTPNQCQCSGCKTDVVPIIAPPSTCMETQKRTRRLTKVMREYGLKELQRFRLKLWQEADEEKTSWTPPSAFIPDATIKILLDHIYIIQSVDDIISRDSDNELLHAHSNELLRFLHDLQIQFEDMRQRAKEERMSRKNKISSDQRDESEDSEDDELSAGEDVPSGIRWILKPSTKTLDVVIPM